MTEREASRRLSELGVDVEEVRSAREHVEQLDFEGPQFTDEHIALATSCPKLQWLTLTNTSVTEKGLAAIKALREVGVLWILGSPVGDAGIRHLADWKELEDLRLDGTGITAKSLSLVAGFPTLRVLLIEGEKLKDADFARLAPLAPRLEGLLLEEMPITDAALEPFREFTAITSLDLSGTHVTDAGLRHFAAAREMHDVTLARTRVEGTAFEQLRSWSKLWMLDCADSPVTDAGARAISRLSTIEMLDLRGTRVTDAGLEHLGALKKLTHLNLQRTAVRGPGLKHLAGLRSLLHLHLDETAVDSESLRHLASLPSLNGLTLDSCANVDSEGMRHLTGIRTLRSLSVGKTKVDDAGLMHLAEMPGFDPYDIQVDRATQLGRLRALAAWIRRYPNPDWIGHVGPGPDDRYTLFFQSGGRCEVREEPPRLQWIHEGDRFTDATLREGALGVYNGDPEEDLVFRNTRVTGRSIGRIVKENIESVRGLDVTGMDVGDDLTAALGRNEYLTDLVLDGTRVTPKGAKVLAGMKSLARLSISASAYTEEVLAALRKCSTLQTLRVDGNEVDLKRSTD